MFIRGDTGIPGASAKGNATGVGDTKLHARVDEQNSSSGQLQAEMVCRCFLVLLRGSFERRAHLLIDSVHPTSFDHHETTT